MKDIEILRVQMDTQEAEGSTSYLEELFKRLKEQFTQTGQNAMNALNNIKNYAKGTLGSLLKTYKELAYGMEKATGGSLKRTVAGFDQLNRLSKSTGKTVVKEDRTMMQGVVSLVESLQGAGQKLQEHLITPLKQIPELGVRSGLSNLGGHLLTLLGITQTGTGQVENFTGAWQKLGQSTQFWHDMVERGNAATVTFQQAMTAGGLQADQTALLMDKLGQSLRNQTVNWDVLSQSSQTTWQSVSNLWQGAQQWFEHNVTSPVSNVFTGLFDNISQSAERSKAATWNLFADMGTHVGDTFALAWGKVAEAFSEGGDIKNTVESGMVASFKKMGNGLIRGLNAVAVEPFAGLNSMLTKLQEIKIGSLRPFSFLTWRASTPKIPYLAQGAVLPANKPFLAMVGDQRHGTNIEAPLSTIQEAVSLAMEDYMQGNMAGHGATVDALRQILNAVLGISIGDETIAAACDRHHQKMRIVNGI